MAKPDPAAMPRQSIFGSINRCAFEEEVDLGAPRAAQPSRSTFQLVSRPISHAWEVPDFVPEEETEQEELEEEVELSLDPPSIEAEEIAPRPLAQPTAETPTTASPEAIEEIELPVAIDNSPRAAEEKPSRAGLGTWDISDLPPAEEVRGYQAAQDASPEEVGQGPIRQETLYEVEVPSEAHTPLDPTRLKEAETYYIMAYDADRNLDESALNMYLDAMIASWQYLESGPSEKAPSKETHRAWDIYHSSLARLIHIAMENGNYDPAIGIKIPVNGGYRVLQTEFVGFQRTAADFNQWHVVGKYDSRFFPTKHKYNGIGVPLVVVREAKKGDRWFPPRLPFGVTALFRPEEGVTQYDATAAVNAPLDAHVEQVVGRLQLFNPKNELATEFRCTETPLARDTTAPYAWWLKEEPPAAHGHHQSPMRLVSRGPCRKQGLFILEPHQKGKIPVVFVDGLLSTPRGWLSIANELDGLPDLANRYEIWAFEYPADRPPLEAAAVLRAELNQVIQEMDPSGFDRDLRKVVLVGTGMGGLLAKMQVINSGDLLWQYTAYQPIDALDTFNDTRDYLRRSWYFGASPHVRRIVFVGTPHDGSTKACQVLSKTASHLTLMPADLRPLHYQLSEDNPAAFRKEMRQRFPTNVDLLHSKSLLLKGIRETPIAPHVKAHSIVANGWWSLCDGQSDGIVPLSSSRLPGVDTEIMVTAKHSNLYRDPGTTCEIIRVLREHAVRPPFTGG